MRHVLRASGAAVRGEGPVDKIFLFLDPQADHRFRPEGAWRSAPDIFAFERLSGRVGRMFELPRRRQMIRPRLRAAREIVVPAHLGDAGERAFAVVAFQ